jgi:UvrD/REP helicase N-terminal domain
MMAGAEVKLWIVAIGVANETGIVDDS